MTISSLSNRHINLFPLMSLPKRKFNFMIMLILQGKNPYVYYNEAFNMSDKDFTKFMINEFNFKVPTKQTTRGIIMNLNEPQWLNIVQKYKYNLDRYFSKYLSKSGLNLLGTCGLEFTEFRHYKNYPCMVVRMRIGDEEKLLKDLKGIYPMFHYRIRDEETLEIISLPKL